MEYKIVQSATIDLFIKEVNAALSDGWVLRNCLIHIHGVFQQPMVRYNHTDNHYTPKPSPSLLKAPPAALNDVGKGVGATDRKKRACEAYTLYLQQFDCGNTPPAAHAWLEAVAWADSNPLHQATVWVLTWSEKGDAYSHQRIELFATQEAAKEFASQMQKIHHVFKRQIQS